MKFHVASLAISLVTSASADDHMTSSQAYAEAGKILNMKRFIYDWLDTDQAAAGVACKANSNAFVAECADKGENYCQRYECDGGGGECS